MSFGCTRERGRRKAAEKEQEQRKSPQLNDIVLTLQSKRSCGQLPSSDSTAEIINGVGALTFKREIMHLSRFTIHRVLRVMEEIVHSLPSSCSSSRWWRYFVCMLRADFESLLLTYY
jgi:hypothetical protein